jgi:hypothetical protein
MLVSLRPAGDRRGEVAEGSNGREAPVLLHPPAEQLLDVGMKCEQVPPVAAHGLVTNALLARDRGGGHRLEQLQAPSTAIVEDETVPSPKLIT